MRPETEVDQLDGPPTRTRGWRRVVEVLGFIVTRVLVEPVQEGRLRAENWSAGLRAVVSVSMISYVILALLTFMSQWFRSHLSLAYRPPDETLPSLLFPFLLSGVVLSLTLAWSALVHLRWWVQLPGMAVLAILLLQLAFNSGDLTTIGMHLIGIAVLIVIMIVRRRREFHWLEFAVGLFVIGHLLFFDVIGANSDSAQFITVDIRLNTFATLFLPMWALAAPLALLAGAAMAELTISTVTWTTSGVWQGLRFVRRQRLLGGVLLGLIVVLAGAQQAKNLITADDLNILGMTLLGVAEFLAVAALCVPLLIRARRLSVIRPDADDLVDGWSPLALPVSLILAGTFAMVLVESLLEAVGLDTLGEAISGLGGEEVDLPLLLSGVLLAIAAWRSAGQGRAARAVLLGAIGGTVLVTVFDGLLHLDATVDGFRTGGYLVSVAVLIMVIVRRRLTGERGLAIALALVLTAVFDYRQWIYEPITAVFTVAGVGAALMVGLIWRLLTDNGFARLDSVRFPRASRVLLAMANSLFAVTTVTMVALLGGNWTLDLESVESIGDHMIGNGLWVAVTLVSVSLAWQGQVIRSDDADDSDDVAAVDAVVQPRWLG